jgi:hypothetical protein
MDVASPCPPLVLIEWLDSGQPVPGWQWLEQIEPRRPHLCVSVGFRDHHPGLGGTAHACRVPPPRSCAKWRMLRDRELPLGLAKPLQNASIKV